MFSGKKSPFGQIDVRCAHCGKPLRRTKGNAPPTKYKKGLVEWCVKCRKELDEKRTVTQGEPSK